MRNLEFLGRDAGGAALLFADEDGNRYSAPITDALRSTVLRGRKDAHDRGADRPLTPRVIQAMLREGISATQIAEQSGTSIDRIRRYEGPVQAEMDRAIYLAQRSRIGTDRDAPTVGDLVVDRLAQRGVARDSLRWKAGRRAGGTWEVTVLYVEDSVEKSATWSLTEPTNSAVALDDTARELTETTRKADTVRALFTPVTQVEEEDEVAPEELLDRQEQLLKRLNAARGRKQPVMIDFDGEESDEALPTIPLLAVVDPSSDPHKPGRVRGVIFPEMGTAGESTGDEEECGKKARGPLDFDGPLPQRPKASEAEPVKKRGRRSVPSWDEIVFGSRP